MDITAMGDTAMVMVMAMAQTISKKKNHHIPALSNGLDGWIAKNGIRIKEKSKV